MCNSSIHNTETIHAQYSMYKMNSLHMCTLTDVEELYLIAVSCDNMHSHIYCLEKMQNVFPNT